MAKLSLMSSSITWPSVLNKLFDGSDLTRGEAAWALDEIMTGQTDPGLIETFLVGLRRKGESVVELSGLVDVMLTNEIEFLQGDARRIHWHDENADAFVLGGIGISSYGQPAIVGVA